MSTPVSALDVLKAQAAADSSGVPNALVNAPPDAGSNALTEQLAILNLPYGESIFAPVPDIPDPTMAIDQGPPPLNGASGGTVVSAVPVYTDVAGDAPLSPLGGCPPPAPAFSVFGLDTGSSVLLVGLGLAWLLGGGTGGRGRA